MEKQPTVGTLEHRENFIFVSRSKEDYFNMCSNAVLQNRKKSLQVHTTQKKKPTKLQSGSHGFTSCCWQIQLLGLQAFFPLCTITKLSPSVEVENIGQQGKCFLLSLQLGSSSDGTPCQLSRAECNNDLHSSVPIHLSVSL